MRPAAEGSGGGCGTAGSVFGRLRLITPRAHIGSGLQRQRIGEAVLLWQAQAPHLRVAPSWSVSTVAMRRYRVVEPGRDPDLAQIRAIGSAGSHFDQGGAWWNVPPINRLARIAYPSVDTIPGPDATIPCHRRRKTRRIRRFRRIRIAVVQRMILTSKTSNSGATGSAVMWKQVIRIPFRSDEELVNGRTIRRFSSVNVCSACLRADHGGTIALIRTVNHPCRRRYHHAYCRRPAPWCAPQRHE